ncbi:MAG: hypothetical protein HY681_00045 [Chloroflexi bacterium]|nr:hypothetical protein [Chloroflexota bacterium]
MEKDLSGNQKEGQALQQDSVEMDAKMDLLVDMLAEVRDMAHEQLAAKLERLEGRLQRIEQRLPPTGS